MGTLRLTGKWSQVAVNALLSLVLALAPLLSQMSMAEQVHATPYAVDPSVSEHAGHDYEQAHDQSDASHHNQGAAEKTARIEAGPNTPCQGWRGTHDSAGEMGCCGTFCHSIMALLAMPNASHQYERCAFISFVGMPTDTIPAEQPHRPPSILMSH